MLLALLHDKDQMFFFCLCLVSSASFFQSFFFGGGEAEREVVTQGAMRSLPCQSTSEILLALATTLD